jgi:multidrug efflux pump subunit AcrA (membrane-fusion protein)
MGSREVAPGLTADLTLPEFPGRRFLGTIVSSARAINMSTRTLLVEIAVANPSGTLLSGSYAEVHLKLPEHHPTYIIPVNTLIFRSEGLHVGVVKDGKMVLTAVTAGHDFGSTIEIVAGINAHDELIVNPPDSIMSGQPVQVNRVRLPGDLK